VKKRKPRYLADTGVRFAKLSFEISLFCLGSFFSRSFFCFFSGSFFFSLFLFTAAAIAIADAVAIVAVAFALAVIAIAIAIALTLALAAAQHLLSPGNDLVAVGGDHINYTGNSSQSSQNLQNSTNKFHKKNLQTLVVYSHYNQFGKKAIGKSDITV
jgi:hypothetical protein